MAPRYRALVYVRKSQVRVQRDQTSPKRQLENCLAAAQAHGWTVDEGDVYRDAKGHRSGRTEDHRPAWRALKARLAADPTVAAVIVDSLDRSSRSLRDFFNFLPLLEEHKVELVSVKEQFDTSTAIGRAFLAMLMIVASLESDLASERMTATVEYLRRQGVRWGRNPYGYSRDENAGLQPDENAPAAITAFELYATGQYSYASLAEKLNQLGHRWRLNPDQPRVPFKLTSIRSLVDTVMIYAGHVPTLDHKEIRAAGSPRTLEEAIEISAAVQGQHEPLIDEELADQVLAAKRIRTRKNAHTDDHVFLLTPLLECANCGGELIGKRDKRGRAPKYQHKGPTCAWRQGSCPSDPLEAEVLALLDIDLDPEIIEDIKRDAAEYAIAQPENEDLKRQLAARRAELDRMKELYILGDLTQAEYITRRSVNVVEIQALEERLGQPDYPLEDTVERIGQLGAILRSGNRLLQKRAMPTIFKRVAVGLDGTVAGVELQDWIKPLLDDIARGGRDSTTRNVAALVGMENGASIEDFPLPPPAPAPGTGRPELHG